MVKLVIGNKKYSSWSLRPWMVLAQAQIPFEEILIGLDLPDTDANIRKYSPSGRVPALIDGELIVWDSLAIAEYLAEKFSEKQLWPADPKVRAIARSVTAEMHSGFPAMREEMTMRILQTYPPSQKRPETIKDVERVKQLWTECRERYGAGGPFLFGAFSIADAFYAPVVSRFRSYAIPVDGAVKAYAEMIWATPAMQRWYADAQAETLRAAKHE